MPRILSSKILGATMLMAGLLSAGHAVAQDAWPTKSIEMIVTAAAGGGSDIPARIVAQHLSKELGVQISVINRSGGNNVPSIRSALEAPADGYTLLFEAPSNSTILLTDPEIPLKIEDRTYLPMLVGGPTSYIVNGKSPINTMEELIARIKSDPATFTWYRAGRGVAYLSLVQVLHVAGVRPEDTKPVDVESGTAGRNAVAGGHIMLGGGGPAGVLSLMQSGDLKVLAVTGNERIPSMPDVPTTAELGLDLNLQNWFSISAPPGLPQAVIDRLDEAAKKVAEDPEFKAALETQGSFPFYLPSAEAKEYILAEFEAMKQLEGK